MRREHFDGYVMKKMNWWTADMTDWNNLLLQTFIVSFFSLWRRSCFGQYCVVLYFFFCCIICFCIQRNAPLTHHVSSKDDFFFFNHPLLLFNLWRKWIKQRFKRLVEGLQRYSGEWTPHKHLTQDVTTGTEEPGWGG